MYQVDMLEFGLLIHPDAKTGGRGHFLGASPDGISTQGIMLEIKCPPCRKAAPYASLYYWIQIIMQLECTGLEYCDFFDCNFITYDDIDDWSSEAVVWEKEYKNTHENVAPHYHLFGMIISFVQGYDDDGDVILKHTYAPPTIVSNEQWLEWEKETRKRLIEEETVVESDDDLTTTLYKLENYYISRVKAQPQWLKDNIDELESVWAKIEYGRTPEGFAYYKSIVDEKEQKRVERAEKKKILTKNTVIVPLDADSAKIATLPASSTKTSYVHKVCLF